MINQNQMLIRPVYQRIAARAIKRIIPIIISIFTIFIIPIITRMATTARRGRQTMAKKGSIFYAY